MSISRSASTGIYVPFVLAFAATVVVTNVTGTAHDHVRTIVGGLLAGTLPIDGPGNYFITLVFQFALVFPLVFWGLRRQPVATLLPVRGGRARVRSARAARRRRQAAPLHLRSVPRQVHAARGARGAARARPGPPPARRTVAVGRHPGQRRLPRPQLGRLLDRPAWRVRLGLRVDLLRGVHRRARDRPAPISRARLGVASPG